MAIPNVSRRVAQFVIQPTQRFSASGPDGLISPIVRV